MECKIITPYKSESLEVKEIMIDSGEGVLAIYPMHTDFISSIKKNSLIKIKTKKEGKLEYFCKQGIIKIQSNKALILIDVEEKS
ncbi:MAG: F0F1 ATP synthase subunit epsilon [bacterium]